MHSEDSTKEKDVLRQTIEPFCLREFVVSSDPRSAQQTAKKPFFVKNHLTRRPFSLKRDREINS